MYFNIIILILLGFNLIVPYIFYCLHNKKKAVDIGFITEVKDVTIPTVRFVELLEKEARLEDMEKNLKELTN